MSMQEYELGILEQYHINVKGTRKTRGAFFCDTEEGVLLLRQTKVSEKRIQALYQLGEHLKSQGYSMIDQMVENIQGSCISRAEDGTAYVLKHWYRGRECDIRRSGEVLDGAVNLAKLHNILRMDPGESVRRASHLEELWINHNKELKKVRQFMRRQSPKGAFELAFLGCFDRVYEWAEAAVNGASQLDYQALYGEVSQEHRLIHGDYNYHNILVTPNGMATTNFEHFKEEVQAEDFYYFLRKAMEKHGWNKRLGDHMINAYCAVRPFSKEELEYVKLKLVYPEKFWKAADAYYRSNKAWIPAKSVEKLELAIMQTEEKRSFLENIFSFHL